MTDVHLNGKFIGTCNDGHKFVDEVKKMRRTGKVSDELNISYKEKEDVIVILTENGRARRPVIIVENGKSKLTDEILAKVKKGQMSWDELVKNGIVEYLDAEEEEDTLIATWESELTKDHTHLELSPLIIFGTQTAMVPYAEHNLSVRVLIGAKTVKQALGLYSSNYKIRIDTDVSTMYYPQKPIVDTVIYDLINYNSHPVGQNITLAIASFEGFNMDDGVIVNKSSIERGMYRSVYYRPYKAEELRYPGGQNDVIETPDKEVSGYRTEESYKYLEEDGIVYPEAELKEEEVMIGKTSPQKFLTSLEEYKLGTQGRRDTSVAIKHGEDGTVESVLITENEEGNKYIRVKIREEKIPEIGDKFATRHGQKGIIGMIYPYEDMPFTESGIVPDLILSPHSIPSRMTIGQLIEMLGTKVGALSGRYIDGTTFTGEKEEDLRAELKKLGFRDSGAETMYDGLTGKRFKAQIFVGGSYYMKLKHMVSNKIHSRARGPVQLLTRQPTEGRSKEGGLRLGEMEQNCLVAHGAALVLNERFSSDKAVVPVCKKCGMIAVYNQFKNKTSCLSCGENAPVTFIEMSYAFKLLLDELKSLVIYPKLVVGPKR